jgi:aurora kinase, other
MSTENNQLINHEKDLIEEDEEELNVWVLEDFEIGVCLGNGKFGYVYKAIEKKNQKEVAIKVISKKIVAQYEFFEQLRTEIEIHTRLMYNKQLIYSINYRHKNIVRMYGYFYDNSYVYLVYEYINKGNLFQLIKNVSRLTEKEASQVNLKNLYLKFCNNFF